MQLPACLLCYADLLDPVFQHVHSSVNVGYMNTSVYTFVQAYSYNNCRLTRNEISLGVGMLSNFTR